MKAGNTNEVQEVKNSALVKGTKSKCTKQKTCVSFCILWSTEDIFARFRTHKWKSTGLRIRAALY